uniref:Uncharacterized protein n=1 Tax=Sphaerodactylus townsendi TaxID=933632 RepID=A0ACB8EZC9_9SAUR
MGKISGLGIFLLYPLLLLNCTGAEHCTGHSSLLKGWSCCWQLGGVAAAGSCFPPTASVFFFSDWKVWYPSGSVYPSLASQSTHISINRNKRVLLWCSPPPQLLTSGSSVGVNEGVPERCLKHSTLNHHLHRHFCMLSQAQHGHKLLTLLFASTSRPTFLLPTSFWGSLAGGGKEDGNSLTTLPKLHFSHNPL